MAQGKLVPCGNPEITTDANLQRLSPDPLVQETYALDYPSIDELLMLLDAKNNSTGGFLELHRELRLAGMSFIDDLAMISERTLYLSANITPEQTQGIFSCGREMIDTVHENHKVEIKEMKDIQENWKWRKAQDLWKAYVGCAVVDSKDDGPDMLCLAVPTLRPSLFNWCAPLSCCYYPCEQGLADNKNEPVGTASGYLAAREIDRHDGVRPVK